MKLVLKIILVIFLILIIYLFIPIDKKILQDPKFVSTKIFDRNGVLLMEVSSDEKGVSDWVTLNDVSKHVINALISGEDKRFYNHFGIDISALFRAFKDSVKSRRIVSGASTITQQLARIIYHIPRRKIYKPLVMYLALKLEIHLSKKDIITTFINRAPFGNQIFGISQAAKVYFNKHPKELSLAESAFLVSIINSPTKYNPYNHLEKVRKRQKYILTQMLKNRLISSFEYELAINEKIKLEKLVRSFKAPHFCYFVLNELKKKGVNERYTEIHTTLDWYLQKEIERIIKPKIDSLKNKNVTNASAIVLENDTCSILAMIGSKDFFDETIDGQVNGCVAIRQPGSTIKPFTYALALEKGIITASSIIEDVPTTEISVGTKFMPRNYSGKFHGPVRMRQALACSYNVPAVRVLAKIGEENLLNRLRKAGFYSLKLPSKHYRLGLTLGDGDVSLLELVRAYSIFSRYGKFKNEYFVTKIKKADQSVIHFPYEKEGIEVFSPQVSYIITDILSDNSARVPAFGEYSPLNLPFPCASKTGTSTHSRDNWTIGYTPRYTVGVWVGNFDGSPMHNISGVEGAGPIYRDIMMMLNKKNEKFVQPNGVVRVEICPESGLLKSSNCPNSMYELYLSNFQPKDVCNIHKQGKVAFPQEFYNWTKENNIVTKENNSPIQEPKITYPSSGDVFAIDPNIKKEYQKIKLKAIVPEDSDKVEWYVDGKKFAITTSIPHSVWWELEVGKHSFKVISNLKNKRIESNEVTIDVE
jgi:penicillin-binding protein 1C